MLALLLLVIPIFDQFLTTRTTAFPMEWPVVLPGSLGDRHKMFTPSFSSMYQEENLCNGEEGFGQTITLIIG